MTLRGDVNSNFRAPMIRLSQFERSGIGNSYDLVSFLGD
jgi:hypothetical protein